MHLEAHTRPPAIRVEKEEEEDRNRVAWLPACRRDEDVAGDGP